MAVEEISLSVLRDEVGDGDAEAVPAAGGAQRRDIALAALAEAEIRPDRDMGDPEAIDQHLGDEGFGLHPGKRCVERQFVKLLHAELFQPVGRALRHSSAGKAARRARRTGADAVRR